MPSSERFLVRRSNLHAGAGFAGRRTSKRGHARACSAHPRPGWSRQSRGWPMPGRGCPVQVRMQVHRVFEIFAPPEAVMAGLVPAIHVPRVRRKAWITGTSPAMTTRGIEALRCTATAFAEPDSRGARPAMTVVAGADPASSEHSPESAARTERGHARLVPRIHVLVGRGEVVDGRCQAMAVRFRSVCRFTGYSKYSLLLRPSWPDLLGVTRPSTCPFGVEERRGSPGRARR